VHDIVVNPPITIKEARKILGVTSKSLSDDQVQDTIVILTLAARHYLQNTGSNKVPGLINSKHVRGKYER